MKSHLQRQQIETESNLIQWWNQRGKRGAGRGGVCIVQSKFRMTRSGRLYCCFYALNWILLLVEEDSVLMSQSLYRGRLLRCTPIYSISHWSTVWVPYNDKERRRLEIDLVNIYPTDLLLPLPNDKVRVYIQQQQKKPSFFFMRVEEPVIKNREREEAFRFRVYILSSKESSVSVLRLLLMAHRYDTVGSWSKNSICQCKRVWTVTREGNNRRGIEAERVVDV